MKKILLIIGLIALLAQAASAKLLVDSISMEPTYIEPGDEVKINVKFHEDPATWKLTSVKTSSGEKLPVGQDKDKYYITKLIPYDNLAKEHILIKKGERDVGHLYYGESWTSPFEIAVKDRAPEAMYGMELQILRTNLDKTAEPEIAFTTRFNVSVQGNPKFTISSDNQLTAGESKKFKVLISNVGGGVAKHVSVIVNASSPLTVLKSSSIYAGDMSGKAYKEMNYDMHVDSSASPRAYNLPVQIRYTDRAGTEQTIQKKLGVKVAGIPMVSSNLDSFDDFMQGTKGTVTVSIINKGFIDAKFLSVKLSDTKDYTVTSNSDIYIGNLASDDFETEDYTIKLSEGASGKIPLRVTISFTEENNNEMHVVEQLLDLNVLTEDEFYELHPKQNGMQQATSMLLAIPAIIVGYLVLWFLFKIIGLITGFLDRKLFRRT